MKKIKIIIVCHFSNVAVREHLPLDNRKFYNRVRRCFGLSEKDNSYVDLASWDTNLIDNLSRREDVDLSVISAHSGLKRGQVHFEMGNVRYWFLRCDVATMMKHLIPSPAIWHALNPLRARVRRIVHSVHPDIIALIGAENAYISGTVLGLEKEYPLIVKAQTVYNNPQRLKLDSFDAKNGFVEKLIFERMCYFSVTTKMHCDLFRGFNAKAYNLKWSFATSFSEVTPLPKEYDFVNFAMSMSEKKGYLDALRALAIVRKTFPDVRLNLVGGGTEKELGVVKALVSELQLQDCVTLTPLFPNQSEMFQHIQQARFALLPCKLDYVSSTIRQAMYYRLPVICYRTEGTERLNDVERKVLIAENGDFCDLASKMMLFLTNPQLALRMSESAKRYADYENDNDRITEQVVADFRAVIANYRDGIPIPTELLFDQVCKYD